MKRNKFYILGFIAILVAGCASKAPEVKQEVVTQYKPVEVPVTVPCTIKPVEKPVSVFETVTTGDSLFVKVRALLADRESRAGYEKKLEAAVDSCNH